MNEWTWNLKVTQNVILKRTIIFGLAAYSAIATVMVLKMEPKTIIIAVEPTGTRIVDSNSDKALESERESFVRRFVGLLYSYDSSNFDERVSSAGDLMTAPLWAAKKGDFLGLSHRIKSSEIVQSVKLRDLRELDPQHYQADLEIKVKRRLEEGVAKIRLDLTVNPTKRAYANPYDMEVADYVETPLN